MIEVYIYKNKYGNVYGYELKNHADPIVCSAVSVLSLNTANSIEAFTNEKVICDYDENGGFFHLEVISLKDAITVDDNPASLLINSFVLGVESIEKEYKKEITVKYREV